MPSEKLERDLIGMVEIGTNAHVRVTRDGDWVILYTEDGGGGKATVSLSVIQALDLASLLKGSAVTASGLRK